MDGHAQYRSHAPPHVRRRDRDALPLSPQEGEGRPYFGGPPVGVLVMRLGWAAAPVLGVWPEGLGV